MEKMIENALNKIGEHAGKVIALTMASWQWRKCYRAVLLELLKDAACRKDDVAFHAAVDNAAHAATTENDEAERISKESSVRIVALAKETAAVVQGVKDAEEARSKKRMADAIVAAVGKARGKATS